MKRSTFDKVSKGSFLERMAQASRLRAKEARAQETEEALLKRAFAMPTPPPLKLSVFNVIAELKRRSPAMGDLVDSGFTRDSQLNAYAKGGAAAISILTEPDEFKGSLKDLQDASASLFDRGIPTMRKDFLTDPYQVLEARAAGASGILAIVAPLSDSEVNSLLNCADELGLFVLLECFDTKDLERTSAMNISDHFTVPVLCGINCRNLKTLKIDFDRFRQLAPHLPPNLPSVAESGITSPEEIKTVAKLGYETVLIGSALMLAEDTAGRLASLKQAGLDELGSAVCS
jgi:indole-3-glycerol phosphate synthase